jgi:hypothetical protein
MAISATLIKNSMKDKCVFDLNQAQILAL